MSYTRLNKKSKEILYASDISHIEDGIQDLESSMVVKQSGKSLSSNDYTNSEKSKLAGIENNANAYSHPTTHPASMIVESTSKQFVSDTEKAEWNSKASEDFVTQKLSTVKVDMSAYSTTSQINSALNAKVDKVSGKALSTNDYTTAEKTKLAGIEAGANNYSHPSTHSASIITETSDKKFCTPAEKSSWNNKLDTTYPSSLANAVTINIGGFKVGDSLTDMTIAKILEKLLCTAVVTPTADSIYYGRLSIGDVGNAIIPYNRLTSDQILKSNTYTMNKTTPKVMGKTSLGLASDTAEGDYLIICVPEGYTVHKDNGIGGKVEFNEELDGIAGKTGANGIDVVLEGATYKLYGEVLITQAEIFFYVDRV